MKSKLFKSKRKHASVDAGDQLHPGEWRGDKRSKSRSCSKSPSPTAAPNPRTGDSEISNQSSSSGTFPHSTLTNPGLPPSTASHNSNTRAGNAMSTGGSPSVAWTGLEQALQALRITTRVYPPLRSVIDDLVSCIPLFEAAARNREDYDDLAIGLKGMIGLLIPHLQDAKSENITSTIKDIAETMRKEVESIGQRKNRGGLLRALSSTSDEEDLIRRYRRIEQLFRHLQGEASLSTWSISSIHFVNTQLNNLCPAKLARYNSELSMEVGRRACTQNTRIDILENVVKWSEDQSRPSIYWMNGMAGTGKTTIAYSTCVALEATKQLAASFFCTRTSLECRDAKRIVPTIAYQLARRYAPFQSALCQVLKEDVDISTGTVASQFDQLLKNPLMKVKDNIPDNLVVVVDALDECSNPYIVELFLGILFRSVVDLPIKFFVTSRPEPIIRQKMMSENERSRSILYLHEIEQSIVQADIELYLGEELACISPTANRIEQLAKRAGKLFIYAATAVRYIRPPGRFVNSQERLETILATDCASSGSPLSIDSLYSVILTAAIKDNALVSKEQERMLLVLWTIVCAFEPVLIKTITVISELENEANVVAALEPLRSVLYVSEHNGLVTTFHASFPDYILNSTRSGQFACNVPRHNLLLSNQCFKIMQIHLRFNICNLTSSFVPDAQVPGLRAKITANIPEELFYACRFWMDHLCLVNFSARGFGDRSHPILVTLNDFLLQRLLFWMEVLNLKACMHISIASTSKLSAWLSRIGLSTKSKLVELASDIQSFIIGYASRPISAYTPHIYLSALPLAPFLSHLLPGFRGLVKVSGTAINRVNQAALSTWESESLVLSTAFSPRGDRIILGKVSGELSVQNTHDGKHCFEPFQAHNEPITSVGTSNDGSQIVTGSEDTTLCVWSLHDGSLVSGPFKGHRHSITAVAFSPDGAYIVSGSKDYTVGLWISHDATIPIRRFEGHAGPVNSVAFSPDGTRIVSGSADSSVCLWDVPEGKHIHTSKSHTGPVELVHFAPDGNRIISFSPYDYHRIHVWDNSNDLRASYSINQYHNHQADSVAISPEGDKIACSKGNSISVWSISHDSQYPMVGPFNGHTKEIKSISYSADGTRIISVSRDQTIRLWNVRGKVPQQLEGGLLAKESQDESNSGLVAFAPNQTCVAISKTTNIIDIYNLDLYTTKQIATGQAKSPIMSLWFSFDESTMFSAHASGTICTWDIRTAKLIDGPRRCCTDARLKSAVCSTDGVLIAVFYRGIVELWDLRSNQSIAFCKPSGSHHWDIVSIFSQTGKRLLTNAMSIGGATIDVWDVESGNRVFGPISNPWQKAVDLSPDGTYIAYCSANILADGALRLISISTEEITFMPCWQQLCGRHNLGYASVKFTPDGLYVACAMVGGCHIWNIRNQTVITALTECSTIPRSILYALDGWCLVFSTPDSGLFQARRFHLEESLFAMRNNGWIVDNQSHPIFWVPPELRSDFPLSNGLFLKRGDSLFVNYNDILVGDEWSKCYGTQG